MSLWAWLGRSTLLGMDGAGYCRVLCTHWCRKWPCTSTLQVWTISIDESSFLSAAWHRLKLWSPFPSKTRGNGIYIKGRTSLLFLGGAFRLDTNMQCAPGMQAWAHPRWDQIPPKGPLRPLRYTLNSCMKGTCSKRFVSLPQERLIRLQSWEHNHTNWNKCFSPDWRAFQLSDMEEHTELLNSVHQIRANEWTAY